MRRIMIGCLLITNLFVACHTSDNRYGSSYGALQPLDGCQELEASLEAAAIDQMNKILDNNLESALKWGGCGIERLDDAEMGGANAGPVPDSGGSQDKSQTEGAEQFSTTNTQEDGVDEADFIKNDGRTIYLVAGHEFLIFKAWPAPETQLLSSYDLEGKPRRLYVRDHQAVIYTELAYENANQKTCYSETASMLDMNPYCQPLRKLKVTILDITDKTKPKLVREIELNGKYVNSRRIGAAVHTVLSFPEITFPEVRYWPEELFNKCINSKFLIRLAFKKLRAANQQLIRNTELTDWLPTIRDTYYGPDGPQTNTSLLQECKNFFEPVLPAGHGLLSVMTLNLEQPQQTNFASIVGQRGDVYASAQALYVATNYWNAPQGMWAIADMPDSTEATVIHKFSLDNQQATAQYQASGVVHGRVLNQFSMGEHKGFLRVATTTGWVGNQQIHNSVFVLEQQLEKLDLAGSLTGIAPGEDIRSARFVKDRGFMVTFKKTDPLFTIDLSNPCNPKLVGELKIPGFSTYIHMMDDDHLLTIGFDTEEAGDFAWFQGIQLQIFDVSDMSKPARTHITAIGTRGTTSEATANHLAFNYFAPKDLLALPMAICEESSGGGDFGDQLTFSGLMVWDLTAEDGFSERGRVTFPVPDELANACTSWWSYPNSHVKRSIVMDDYVFSISNNLMKVNNLDDLATDILAIELPVIPSDDPYFDW